MIFGNDSRGICAYLQVKLVQSHKNDDQQLDPWWCLKQHVA
jgi:hypothetical protein